ncbi:MAG: YIP1 family protein [Methanocaldococcus sp.]
MNLIEALTNPETFFKKLSQKEIPLKEPFLIVLIFSILIAISAYISTSAIYKIFPPQYQQMMAFMKIIGLISTFIGGIVSWLIMAGIMYLISIAFKGKGGFKKNPIFYWLWIPSKYNWSYNNNPYCLLLFITSSYPTINYSPNAKSSNNLSSYKTNNAKNFNLHKYNNWFCYNYLEFVYMDLCH